MAVSKLSFSNHLDVGDLIRELRQALGLTQEKFAAKLGVRFPTVNRWQNKHAKPSPLAMEKIEALAKRLGKTGKD
ncbi:MAG: helix-turn-helix domain-containing protein [Phormidesmis sp. CAN_BIN44]|nr:helix-turn-helix domain-containing protein [Phormidesmis sp. CAN_BIN44]